MRSRTQRHDDAVTAACRRLVEQNEPVTARRVGRETGLSVTSITRSESRMAIVRDAIAEQEKLSSWLERQSKSSKAKVARLLAEKDQKISDLEQQITLLQASHKAMILAVGELGGMQAWQRFFEKWREFNPDSILVLQDRSA